MPFIIALDGLVNRAGCPVGRAIHRDARLRHDVSDESFKNPDRNFPYAKFSFFYLLEQHRVAACVCYSV